MGIACMKKQRPKIKHQFIYRWTQHEGDEYLELMEQTCDTDEVKTLGLTSNGITIKGIIIFVSLTWSNLHTLIFQGNLIGDKGCKQLTKVRLNSLKTLNLTNCNLGGAGLIHLAKSKWEGLKFLYLKNNKLTLENLTSLTRNNWTNLNQIYISQKSDFNPLRANRPRTLNNEVPDVQIILMSYEGQLYSEYCKFVLFKRKIFNIR